MEQTRRRRHLRDAVGVGDRRGRAGHDGRTLEWTVVAAHLDASDGLRRLGLRRDGADGHHDSHDDEYKSSHTPLPAFAATRRSLTLRSVYGTALRALGRVFDARQVWGAFDGSRDD